MDCTFIPSLDYWVHLCNEYVNDHIAVICGFPRIPSVWNCIITLQCYYIFLLVFILMYLYLKFEVSTHTYSAGQLASPLSLFIPSWCPAWCVAADGKSSQILFQKVLDRCCGSMLMSDKSQTKATRIPPTSVIYHLHTQLYQPYILQIAVYICVCRIHFHCSEKHAGRCMWSHIALKAKTYNNCHTWMH